MDPITSSFILHPSSLLTTPAVIPVLVGPLQVLLAILPGLLVALGGLILSMFKPSAAKQALKILWRLKIPVAISIVLVVGGVKLVRVVWVGGGAAVSDVEAGASNWPMFRRGLERRGATTGDDPTRGGVVWTFMNEVKTFYCSPAVVGNRVYVASADKGVFKDSGAIYCLDAETGGIVWKSAPKGFRATYSSPAICDGYLVCGEGLHFTRDARVVCLDVRNDGRLLWQYRTKSHVESSPCIYDGRVYIGAGDDGYYCFELEPASSGKPEMVWHAPGDRFPDAETAPAVVDGRVYVGLGMGGRAVCCLDAKTGEEVWRIDTPYPVFAPPTVSNGKIFVGMGNGNMIETAEQVMANELRTLREQGKTEAELEEAEKALRPAGEVWCIDATSAKVDWKFEVDRTVLGAVVAGEDRIFFGSRDGHLYCVSFDGDEIDRWNTRAPIIGSPALGEEHVYVVTDTGMLYAVRAEDMRPVWEIQLGAKGPFVSSPAAARGHIYVGSEANGLLCVGSPGDESTTPIWAGHLGGAGRGGNIDGSPLVERGALLWRHPAMAADVDSDTSITAPAACVGEYVYVPVRGPKPGLLCLKNDPAALEAPGEHWFFETSNPATLSPAATDQRVFFVDGTAADADRRLHCIESRNGAELWFAPVAFGASGNLVLCVDSIVVEHEPGALACFDLSGNTLWCAGAGSLYGSPACQDAILVAAVASTSASLVALDRFAGDELWRIALRAAPRTGPAVRGKTVYLGTNEGIAAHSLIDGGLLWQSGTGAVETAFSLGRDWIAYINSESTLVLVDPKTGEAGPAVSRALSIVPPLLSRGSVLYASRVGLMRYALAEKRSRRWMAVSWLGELSSPLILADSRVYFATDRKGLVCAGKR